jgi:two-component system alkaline phosphatase synthesis response regulator PhoP
MKTTMIDEKHILVVEDEEHLAVGIRYNLEAENYRVTVAADGPTALRIADEQKGTIDLVVLDLMLPGMSGYKVCETLRGRGETMPILILSARTLTEDRTRGFDTGADQYLNKPFDLDELLSRVKNLLARHDASTKVKPAKPKIGACSFGKAEVNFDTYEVHVSGKPVRLTRQMMDLLYYFVENEGRVIPKSELLEQIWGMPGHVQTRAPDQFIHRLRRTFEDDPAEPVHFLTVRDAGYRFVAESDEGSSVE